MTEKEKIMSVKVGRKHLQENLYTYIWSRDKGDGEYTGIKDQERIDSGGWSGSGLSGAGSASREAEDGHWRFFKWHGASAAGR